MNDADDADEFVRLVLSSSEWVSKGMGKKIFFFGLSGGKRKSREGGTTDESAEFCVCC